MEDQFNHADDQDTDLNQIRKCDHRLAPFLLRSRGLKKLPPLYKTKGGTHRVLLADSTLTDSIPQSAKKDKPYSEPCQKLQFLQKVTPPPGRKGCISLEFSAFSEGLEFSEVLAAAGDVDNPAQPEYNRHRRRVPPTTTSVVPP